jgi:hypothetical protein
MMGYSGGEGTDTTNEFGLMWWRFEDESLEIIDHQAVGEVKYPHFFRPRQLSP